MDDKEKLISKKAADVMALAMDTLIVNMRFMDVAMNRLKYVEKPLLQGVANDAEYFYYDSSYILKSYIEDENSVTRKYLHSLLHCIFNHSFDYDRVNQELWDISCDIAVENIIMELELPALTLATDVERKSMLRGLYKELNVLTAQKIYRHFLINPLAKIDKLRFIELFAQDRHVYWSKAENYEISAQDWQKISERIKTDLSSFSKNASHSESLIKNLTQATKERYDYKKLLERFTVMGEELTVNDEEFDYIYYTYGLSHYGNMPLIEPLEFKDVKKVRDFAIVLDTSASCQGGMIKAFLKTTYDILKNTESFFSKINVHIIQCDNEVHSDVKIASDSDFEDFIKNGKLVGYGGTDFRPAFDYVDGLIADNEYENFKGLIYFTDGYGIYPHRAPDYDCMFVFVKRDDRRPELPWWGIRVELEEDYFEYTAG